MNIIIFENNDVDLMFPFTINHASFEIRVGAFTNLERIALNSNNKISLIVREDIQDIIKERFPQYDVNPSTIPSGLCINGATVITGNNFKVISNAGTYSSNDKLISFYLDEEISMNNFYDLMYNNALVSKQINIDVIKYLWDAIFLSEKFLLKDIELKQNSNNFYLDSSAITIGLENIIFGANSVVKAGVILDSKNGPIIIDENAIIGNGAILEGPIYIGKHSIISPGAKIRSNTSIGPMCKVGGENSAVIFQGYSNKVHDGFLGHSYISEWVNIGAGTNNSNLKNNYSLVKFDFGHTKVNTDKQFLGVMIGDYTRIGISTMINTGTYIGLGANVFGGDFQPKFIDSFNWGQNEKVDFDKFIQTVNLVKSRRNKIITEKEKIFLKKIYLNN